MPNVIFKSKTPYVIGYRYGKYSKFTWQSFDDLSIINHNYKFAIKNCTNFRLFKYENDKYKTIFSKQILIRHKTKKLIRAIAKSEHKDLIMRNIRSFREKIQKSLEKK